MEFNKEWPEITVDTSTKDLKLIHMRIWDCVIRSGAKPDDVPYISGCVACEYARKYRNLLDRREDIICDYCPIVWPNGKRCGTIGSLFDQFNKAGNNKFQRDTAALLIRNVSFKKPGSKWPVITADTPIEEVQEIHKKIWTDTITDKKKPTDTGYEMSCAACEYAVKCYQKERGENPRTVRDICSYCPIEWPNGKKCYEYESLFGRWSKEQYSMEPRKFIELAAQIKNVPFKKKEFEWPEITIDTPLEEIKRIHQDIWDYVVKTGKKPNTPYRNGCVLCEYVIHLDKSDYINPCGVCPAKWSNDCHCGRYGSLFSLYTSELDPIRKRRYAELIRDIPFKEEEKKEPSPLKYEVTLTLLVDGVSIKPRDSSIASPIEEVMLTVNGKKTKIKDGLINVYIRMIEQSNP